MSAVRRRSPGGRRRRSPADRAGRRALLGAFACWRSAAAQRRAELAEDDPIDAGQFDEAGLLRASRWPPGSIGPAAATLDAALLAALAVLRSSWAAATRSPTACWPWKRRRARPVTLIEAGLGGRGVEHRVRLTTSLGTALRDGRAAGAARAFACCRCCTRAPLAVLQLGPAGAGGRAAGLAALFELVGLQLAEAARREATPR